LHRRRRDRRAGRRQAEVAQQSELVGGGRWLPSAPPG